MKAKHMDLNAIHNGDFAYKTAKCNCLWFLHCLLVSLSTVEAEAYMKRNKE